ncbi:MAG: Maf family protein [Parahaliea sp.]
MMKLILASTSPYRKQLLQRLGVPFECVSPAVEEFTLPGESAPATAIRLALAKAQAVALWHPQALIIGADQVATLDDIQLGKPGNHARAAAQLAACSGRSLTFHTALTLMGGGHELVHVEPFHVTFRHLSTQEIEHYLQRDKPWDCAGSFKWESLGIALFEKLSGRDPTSLQGLPLIALTRLLAQAGQPVL